MSPLTSTKLLPDSWEAKPLRSVVDYAISNVDKLSKEWETPIRLCNYTDVYNNEYITAELDFMSATASMAEIEKFGIEVDDVIITKDSESHDDIGVPTLVRETTDNLVCGYHLALLRPKKDKVEGAFLFRCLQAKSIRAQIEVAANGITRFGVPKTEIGKVTLPIPPLASQHAIIDYLDRQTAQLDALLTTKERVVASLTERRQSLISSAVTRGLESGAVLRNSGIPWLGDIPENWRTERSKWLFKERDERSDTGEEELLTVSHLTGVTRRSEKDVNMFRAATNEGYKICRSGDLAINTMWAWMGAMGVAAQDGIVSPAYNVYEPAACLDPRYVDALVRLPAFAREATRYSTGVWSSRLRLYPEGFFSISIPVPPLSEQRDIVARIEYETRKMDKLLTATKRTIDLLKERRAALISEAVSGQLDVNRAA